MASEIEPITQAVQEFYEYAQALVRARREDPSDDLISKLIAAEEEGERLSDVECINLVFNVLVGGVDTSQSQLAHAVRLLAEHPDQWELLAQDPSLAERAVEEALRYEPITPFTARILVEDVVYRDVTFPEGTVVMVCAFTGNRDLDDEDAGPGGADSFDITADRGRARPLTFGAGVHYCLGANLARVELQEGLAFLAEHLHDLRLDGEPVFEGVSGIYGLAELPIAFTRLERERCAAPSVAARRSPRRRRREWDNSEGGHEALSHRHRDGMARRIFKRPLSQPALALALPAAAAQRGQLPRVLVPHARRAKALRWMGGAGASPRAARSTTTR